MKYPTDSLWQHMCPISRDQCKQNSHESYLLFINFLSVVRFYPSISVSRSAGYKVHLKLMVKVALILFIIHPSQTDGRGCTSFSFQSLSTSKHSILSIILSHLSEFSIVSHENCTIGKLTLSSIQPHRATLSIRPSPLTRVLSKVSSNILQFASPHLCHISVSFQLFFAKIAPLESSRYPLFIRIKRRYPLGRLH